ncbi:hypothetical protein HDE_10342 [Halotydeus destructor]|nr:hypothetical protein HDE_10342 [Halotydeus destructor]
MAAECHTFVNVPAENGDSSSSASVRICLHGDQWSSGQEAISETLDNIVRNGKNVKEVIAIVTDTVRENVAILSDILDQLEDVLTNFVQLKVANDVTLTKGQDDIRKVLLSELRSELEAIPGHLECALVTFLSSHIRKLQISHGG